jgi:hypothetical protein
MPTRLTLSFDRTVHPEELRAYVEQINLRDGLEFVTKEAARAYREPEDGAVVAYNPLNLALLAKAFVLWGDPSGRPLRRAGGGDDDRLWLVKATNSLPWHAADAADRDSRTTMTSFFVRQAHLIVATDDPLDASIARTFEMFHEIIGRGGFAVPDPSAELQALYGLSAEDLWVLCMAIFSFSVAYARIDPRVWVFTGDFFEESPRRDELKATLSRALARIARTPEELRALYAEDPEAKYRDRTGAVGAWISEFNVLRDFPVVRLGPDEYCVPFPPFAFTRGSVGFYFDLVGEFARRKRAAKAKGNPFDNAMSQTLGQVFQAYVGEQLSLLPESDRFLLAEYPYGTRKRPGDTPDWILHRPGELPVFFECKARRPSLGLQRSARPADLESEIEGVVSRALGQFCEFLTRADEGAEKIRQYGKLSEVIFALVLYEPFAYHALPHVRALIDRVASTLDRRWDRLKHRVRFVPMWIRELETAVGLERSDGVRLERQLAEYADYRMSAPPILWDGASAQLAKHLEEYLLDRWHGSRRVENPLCTATWDRFTALSFRRIFDQELGEFEAAARHRATEGLAYQLWNERGRPLWDAERDWRRAEEALATGEPPLGPA